MHIDDACIAEFQELYEKEFDETISLSEARHMVQNLLELYVQLAKPLPDKTE